MADLVAILNFIIGLMPLIDKVVSLIESMFSRSSGDRKKAMAVSMVNALVAAGAPGVVVPDGVVGKMIDGVVWAKNVGGVFTHESPGKVEVSPFEMLGPFPVTGP